MKLRFTIRDLLWLMVVLALSVSWWLSYRQMQARITQLQSAPPMVSINDDRVQKAMQVEPLQF
jgi:hypothetical protein